LSSKPQAPALLPAKDDRDLSAIVRLKAILLWHNKIEHLTNKKIPANIHLSLPLAK